MSLSRLSSGGSESTHCAQSPPFITLLTDFGLSDSYVGVMKGVIGSINPDARVVDLSHDIPPQDVQAGAFLLAGSYSYFPPGTIHVAVVDPTVGSDRPAICVRAGQYLFVGPDNGLLSIACYRAGRPGIFLLENERYFLEERSHTFHGRDVFAPVAAHLSRGMSIESMGPRARSMERIRVPRPSRSLGRYIRGEIVYIDRFGNLVSNIEPALISENFPDVNSQELVIGCGDNVVRGLSKTYCDAPTGTPLALVGSYGLLEIAVRDGNAGATLGAQKGERVTINVARGKPGDT